MRKIEGERDTCTLRRAKRELSKEVSLRAVKNLAFLLARLVNAVSHELSVLPAAKSLQSPALRRRS